MAEPARKRDQSGTSSEKVQLKVVGGSKSAGASSTPPFRRPRSSGSGSRSVNRRNRSPRRASTASDSSDAAPQDTAEPARHLRAVPDDSPIDQKAPDNVDQPDAENAQQAAAGGASGGQAVQQYADPYDKETDKTHDPSLAQRERDAAEESGNKSKVSKKEQDTIDKKPKSSNAETAKKKPKKKISRPKKILISVLIAVMGGGIFGVATLSGPIKLVQFAQTLQKHFSSLETLTDDRSSRFTTFRRLLQSGSVQSTRLGTVAGKYADRWDQRLNDRAGIRPVYDRLTGRMVGFEVTDERKARNAVQDFEQDGTPIVDSDPNARAGRDGDSPISGRIISLRDTAARTRRSSIRGVVNGLDINKVSSAVGSRVLIRLGGVDFHPLKNLQRRSGEKIVDYYDRKQAEREERIRNGARPPNARGLDSETTTDDDGNTQTNPDSDAAADGGLSEIDDAIDASNNGDLDAFEQQFTNKLLGRVGGGALAAFGAVCVVRDLGNQAEELQFNSTILPMIRMGFEFMAVGSQILAFQDLNLNEINFYAQKLYDQERKIAHVAAASIQYENGQPPTGEDISSAVKPDSVNGKPLVFRAIDAVPGIDTGCKLTDVVGLISRIPIIGDVTEALTSFASDSFDSILEAAVGVSVSDFIGSIVAWMAGEAVDTDASGATLGNYANYGARLASNTQSQAFGGRELNQVETAELRSLEQQRIAKEKESMGLFERYLSPETPGSLTLAAAGTIANGSNSLGSLLLRNPISSLSSVLPRASAQETNAYDYGFAKVGFSATEAENELIADPFENAEFVESNFDELNERYEECFPVRLSLQSDDIIVSVDSFADSNVVNQFTTNKDLCNNPNDDDLLRFRAYLADTMIAKSLNCYEGDTTSCNEIAFNGQGIGGTLPGSVVGEITEDTTNLPCAPEGLMGEEIRDIPGPNQAKVCNYGSDIWVNASWSPTISAMFAEARAAGIDVRGGAWRDPATQVRLYRDNCGNGARRCNPPTAPPGTSMHEYGLAIDFSHITETCGVARGIRTCPQSATYRWLVDNAVESRDGPTAATARYRDVIKLSSEAWHWSFNGR